MDAQNKRKARCLSLMKGILVDLLCATFAVILLLRTAK
jgi:hypothetical protein